MTNDQIIELAKQAGDDWDHTLQSDKEFLQRFAELVRNEVLEEAAKVCEQNADCCNEGGVLHQLLASNATAIRSLKK